MSDGLNDVTIRAAYASVVEDEGTLFIGFAEGEDEEEPYALFRQSTEGGPVTLELGDEAFSADDAVEAVVEGAKGLTLTLRPTAIAALGWASTVEIRLGPLCEDAGPAVLALRQMLGEAVFAAPMAG